MSKIQPFPGLRPKPELVQQVASPPYDVLSSEEARELVADNPHSFLHVVKSEIDLEPGVDSHGEEVYQKGAENLQKLIDQGTLVRDPSPCFYIYELVMGEHSQTGLVIGASVDEYVDGSIKKHEHTRLEKEMDRARHLEVLKANAGPVLFTYKAQDKIDQLIKSICQRDVPVYNFTAEDEVIHRLWVVAKQDDIEKLQKAFQEVPAFYVADGHHRTASAYRVREIFRAKDPHPSADKPYNYFLSVVFPDNQLQIMGYHRVVKDLNGLTSDDFLKALKENFSISPAEHPTPKDARHFTMFLDGKWYQLQAKSGTFSPDHPVESLDVSILQNNLLQPILGIDDPRTSDRIDFVGAIRGTKELERRCSTDMKVAFAFYPVSVAQLMALADSGEVMPPKSTWFEPKLRSGIVVRTY